MHLGQQLLGLMAWLGADWRPTDKGCSLPVLETRVLVPSRKVPMSEHYSSRWGRLSIQVAHHSLSPMLVCS